MALWKTKNMDEIDDISEMVEAMRVLEVSSKGLKTLEEMKDRVRTTLQLDADKIPSWIEGKVGIYQFIRTTEMIYTKNLTEGGSSRVSKIGRHVMSNLA